MIVLHRWKCTLCAETVTRQSQWALVAAVEAHIKGHEADLVAEVTGL